MSDSERKSSLFVPEHQADENDEIQPPIDQTTCECGKSFSNKSNLRFHQRNAHAAASLYSCNKCGQRFTFKRQLTAHRAKYGGMCKSVFGATIEEDYDAIDEQHKQPNGIGHPIFKDTKKFKKKSNQSKPMKNRRIFKCEDCGRCFTFKSNLRTHQRNAHSDRLPYTCHECGAGFSYKKELRLHRVSTHMEMIECVFECWLCHET